MQLNQTKIEKLGKALIKSTSIEQDNQILESFKLKYNCSMRIYFPEYIISDGLRRYYLNISKDKIYVEKLSTVIYI